VVNTTLIVEETSNQLIGWTAGIPHVKLKKGIGEPHARVPC
jgi:hypothetical protein